MYEIITLDECKEWLNINSTNTDKDVILNSLRKWITDFIESYINKKIITREFVEYHDGMKKENLFADQYPVYSVESLYDDPNHDYGANELIASDDYRIYYDIGEIKLTDDETIFSNGEQNVKLTYRAGMSRFLLVDEANNYIDIRESISGTDCIVEFSIPAVPIGKFLGYDAEGLATAIQTALRADANLTLNYIVAYNQALQKFEISTNTNFDIKWNNGDSKNKSIASLLGYKNEVDTGCGLTHSSDYEVIGVPEDLKLAALQILDYTYEQTNKGKGRLTTKRESMPHGQGTTEFITEMPYTAKIILDSYSRTFL